MPKFTVIYVKGRAVIRGASVEFDASPGRSMLEVVAADRPTAYVKAYEHLAKLGLDIFVAKNQAGNGNPLGFSDSEVEAVKDAKFPFQTDLMNGVRIEKIVLEK